MIKQLAGVWAPPRTVEFQPARRSADHPLTEPDLTQEERQFLLRLRNAMHRTIDSTPADFGFDRLQRDLDAVDRRGGKAGWFARLERMLMRIAGL